MVVYEKVIAAHVNSELPFMATENILMECVKRGGDRQELHERIRVHSIEAARQVKEFGNKNDLIERILNDDYFPLTNEEVLSIIDPSKFTGRASGQVSDFINEYINPILESHKSELGEEVNINC